MTCAFIRHDEVCGQEPKIFAGIWAESWGLGAVLHLHGTPLLRVLLGKWQLCVRPGKRIEKMTKKEVQTELRANGIDPEVLKARLDETFKEMDKTFKQMDKTFEAMNRCFEDPDP